MSGDVCDLCLDTPCPECQDRGVIAAGTGDYGDEEVTCPWCLGEPCPECGAGPGGLAPPP